MAAAEFVNHHIGLASSLPADISNMVTYRSNRLNPIFSTIARAILEHIRQTELTVHTGVQR